MKGSHKGLELIPHTEGDTNGCGQGLEVDFMNIREVKNTGVFYSGEDGRHDDLEGELGC